MNVNWPVQALSHSHAAKMMTFQLNGRDLFILISAYRISSKILKNLFVYFQFYMFALSPPLTRRLALS